MHKAVLVPALLLLLSSTVAHAQSILLSAQENSNGLPMAPPLAVREGLAAALFDSGFVVLDLPPFPSGEKAPDLLLLAESGSADFILQLTVDFTDEQAGAGVLRISLHAACVMTEAGTGRPVLTVTRDGSNRDREHAVDRASLGAEIGRQIAADVAAALGSAPGR